jgi:hypothetical protein
MESPKYTSQRSNDKVQALISNSPSRERDLNTMLGGNSEIHTSKPGEAKRIDI